MKSLLVIIFAGAIISACNQSTSPVLRPLAISFTLTDTTGTVISQTRTGQNFVLSFSLVNTTPDTLTYGWANTDSAVVFRILRDGSERASSVDGYIFEEYDRHASLPPRDTLRARWLAPTTPAQHAKVVLAPGTYQARVDAPYFYNIKVDPIPDITFDVVS